MDPCEKRRLYHWLDVIAQLVREPLTDLPHRLLLREFAATFEAEPSWNYVGAEGALEFELLHPPADWPAPEQLEYWRSEGMKRHPLIKWFAATGTTDAQSLSRVPYSVADRGEHDVVHEHLRDVGLDEQLAIPYRLDERQFRGYVLARTGDDFSDADVRLARQLQPLLRLVERQIEALSGGPVCPATVAGADLTGRELAVLRLLAEGHTALSIGRRLSSSPRTVQKHLEHIYRKLEVRDRLMAIRIAEDRGLLSLRVH